MRPYSMIFAPLAVFGTISFFSCAPTAKVADVPTSKLALSEDVTPFEFEAKSVQFASSTLFLWREDTTAADARAVMEKASEVDSLYDDLGRHSENWRRFDSAVAAAGLDRAALSAVEEERVAKQRVYDKAKERVEAQELKIRQLEERKALATSAAEKKSLETQLNRANNLKKTFGNQAQAASDELEALTTRNRELGGENPSYLAFKEQMPRISAERLKIEDRVKSLLDSIAGSNGLGPESRIVGLVDPFEQSVGSFVLNARPDGQLEVKIEMGSLEDVNDSTAKVYSTENGKVVGARFTSLGGLYEFDIELPYFKHNNPRTERSYSVEKPVRLHWKLARTQLSASDRHVRIKGDLELYDRETGALLRRGVAKLDSGEKFEQEPRYWDANEEGVRARVLEARRRLRGTPPQSQ